MENSFNQNANDLSFDKTNVEYLEKSLLYHMSLGSKELFHSNVWAWLIKYDPEFLKVFFPDFDENVYEITYVHRECRHRDLIIWLHKRGFQENKEKYFYVIENKIKSLQSEEQLKEYSENLWDNTILGGVFTGIINALNSNTLSLPIKNEANRNLTWTFVPYNEISKNIIEVANKSKFSIIKEHFAQIKEYCEIIDAIYGILRQAINYKKGILQYNLNENMNKDLNDLRLMDVFVKLKGSDFFNYIINEHKAELECLVPREEGFELDLRQGFNNGNATLDFRFTKWIDDYDHITIGIQVQGCQYRILSERGGAHSEQEIFDTFKDKWFDGNFNKSGKDRKLFGKHKTSLSELFDRYIDKNGRYVFVYQYYNIDNWTYDDIFVAIKRDLEKAKNIILSKDY